MNVIAPNRMQRCIALLLTGAIGDVTVGPVRAATYVVDQAAPGAADTNPGTAEEPFMTAQRAAEIARPGDTIYVMAGKYDERVKVKTGGDPRLHVFETVLRRQGIDLNGKKHAKIEAIEVVDTFNGGAENP